MKPDAQRLHLIMQEYSKRYSQIVAKAWGDDAFKQRLITGPVEVLQEHGIEVPAGARVRIAEGAASTDFLDGEIVLPLPPKPTSAELSDEELEGASGGISCCSTGTCTAAQYDWSEPARTTESSRLISSVNPLTTRKIYCGPGRE